MVSSANEPSRLPAAPLCSSPDAPEDPTSHRLTSGTSSNSPSPTVLEPKPVRKALTVCVIGDSISGYLDHKVMENAMKGEIRSTPQKMKHQRKQNFLKNILMLS